MAEQPTSTAERSAHQTLGEIGARLRASSSYAKVASRAQDLASALQHTAVGWASKFWSANSTVQNERRQSDAGEIAARTTRLHRRIEEMAENLQDGSVAIDENWLLEFTETHQQYMESCSCQGVDFNVLGSTEDFLQLVLLNPKVQAVLRKLEGHDDVSLGLPTSSIQESSDTSVSHQSAVTSRSGSSNFSPDSRVELDDSVDEQSGIVASSESISPSVASPDMLLDMDKREDAGLEANAIDHGKVDACTLASISNDGDNAREVHVLEQAQEPEHPTGKDDRNMDDDKGVAVAANLFSDSDDRVEEQFSSRTDWAQESKRKVGTSTCEFVSFPDVPLDHALDSMETNVVDAFRSNVGHLKESVPLECEAGGDEQERIDAAQAHVDVRAALDVDAEKGKLEEHTPSTGNRFGVQLRRNQPSSQDQSEGDRELLAKLEARRQHMANGGALSPRSLRAALASSMDELEFDGPLDGNFAGMTMQQKMAARRRRMEQVE